MEEKKGILEWIKERLKEPSTVQGVVAILASIGVVVSPELLIEIVAVAGSVIGLILMIRKERVAVEEVPDDTGY